jgi:hypothetical protein
MNSVVDVIRPFSKSLDSHSCNLVVMRLLIILYLLVAGVITALCQNSPVASTVLEDWFDQTVGVENSGLINGQQYKMKYLGSKTNPFFRESESQGAIRFNQQHYTATLLYDIYQDVIVVKHVSKTGKVWFVQPEKSLIDFFTIHDRSFRNIDGSFYQVLYDKHPLRILTRWSKAETVRGGVRSYELDRQLLFDQHGKRSRLTSLSSLVNVLNKTDRDKARSFIKENKIPARKFSDDQLVKLATFIASFLPTNSTP